MDVSILTGMVSEEEMREERPELVQRLLETGQLKEHLEEAPTTTRFMLAVVGGVLALTLGLALLAGILIAQFL